MALPKHVNGVQVAVQKAEAAVEEATAANELAETALADYKAEVEQRGAKVRMPDRAVPHMISFSGLAKVLCAATLLCGSSCMYCFITFVDI